MEHSKRVLLKQRERLSIFLQFEESAIDLAATLGQHKREREKEFEWES